MLNTDLRQLDALPEMLSHGLPGHDRNVIGHLAQSGDITLRLTIYFGCCLGDLADRFPSRRSEAFLGFT
jgi:hypothetical protein